MVLPTQPPVPATQATESSTTERALNEALVPESIICQVKNCAKVANGRSVNAITHNARIKIIVVNLDPIRIWQYSIINNLI